MRKLFLLSFVFINFIFAFSEYDESFKEYGEHFGIPPLLLKNIAKIESSLNPHCINHNKNGTIDYGIMQINTVHFAELQRYGVNERNIMNPKVNIMAGAILVKKLIDNNQTNYDSIGKYHSKTSRFKSLWVQKLSLELRKSR
ncbi:MAG TPA: lytic transglycosylase domain-containing protein [Campylobacterales bacterium]|nr:lytic transglycosylase domain-containing protein [Campylobacterales bacterium]